MTASDGAVTRRRQLEALLYPRSVALIGASGDAARLTARPQRFLEAHGFGGDVHPVNPNRETVLGRAAYRSIGDVPGQVDHAYILLDTHRVAAALEDCARAGVTVASILADGFAEAGAEGEARQRRLVDIARASGMLVIGPNSMGVVEPERGFVCTTNAAFRLDEVPGGRTAVLSQSGSMIGALASRGAAVGIGFAASVSLGNEALAGVGEVGELLVDDPRIDGFVLFLETLRRPQAVARFAARARAAGKRITAYLVGRSEAGSRLAVSHTGAMVGGARALEGYLQAHGIDLAETFETLVEQPCALRLARQLEDRPRTATVVTTTGGGGGMVYDRLALLGASLSEIPAGAARRLSAAGIPVRPGPLVDVTLAGARYETMKAVMSELMRDPATGVVVAVIGSSAQFDPELAVRPIVDARRELGEEGAPVVAVPLPDARASIALLNAGGVPAFRTVESCAESVAALLRPAPRGSAPAPDLPDHVGAALDELTGTLGEVDSASVIRGLGIDLVESLVLAPDAAPPEPLPFDGPYVVKLVSPQLAHKSDVGAVRLGLADCGQVVSAIATMKAQVAALSPPIGVDAVLVQPVVDGLGEVLVGLTRDPVVGPVITVGVGGVLSELYGDLAVRPAPVSVAAARAMIEQVRGLAPLRGFRGLPRGDLDALASVVAALSALAGEPRVEEAELNPVIVRGKGAVAVDALIRLASRVVP